MKIKLIIDYRERDFLNIINTNNDNADVNLKDVVYEVQNLEIGDFVIKNENEEVLFIIERKTINDLACSIVDGRFEQQKERITSVINYPEKIVYVLEGNKSNIKSNISTTSINGAIQNMIFKHNFKVISTSSILDTYNNLIMLYKKCVKNTLNKDESVMICPVNVDLKSGSKKNVIDKNIFALQLCVIPGVSFKTATIITTKYQNIFELCNAYNLCENTDKEYLLSDIEISTKRKLGKSLSKKIYQAIFCNNNVITM